ncbi:MAG: farnesyl diphosphate synthase [Eubacterium sp.]|nr:farnesyl diphosphate synthase [Eubacterium sp.]
MNFQEEIEEIRKEADSLVLSALPDASKYPGVLAEAMNYSIETGGKRVRPILMLLSFRMFGGSNAIVGPFAAAIEMIHTHSLIHDDLPAIDDDDIRRGHATVHARYGEAMGVLAGDALLNYAYETALKAFDYSAKNYSAIISALHILTGKTGLDGMLGGQGLDVENEKSGKLQVDRKVLDYINRHKTSALIEAPLMIGAALAGAGKGEISCMEEIGRRIGEAFQIQDDILDVVGNEAELGKKAGIDARNQKTTYVTILGVEGAEKRVSELTDEAIRLLDTLPGEKELMSAYLKSLAGRNS